MTRIEASLLLLALVAACSRNPGTPGTIVIRVDGMQRGEGGRT